MAFVQSVQLPGGGFVSQSSAALRPFVPKITYNTSFTPALILGALADVETAKAVREPLAAWLVRQKSPDWSFNYWAADAPQRQTLPYPDDLDDTFCTLSALMRHDALALDGAVLGAAVRLLVAAESKVGGPYHTWLVPSDAPAPWQDVDIAVNSNVAYFLALAGSRLPALTAFMEEAITAHAWQSPYYPSPYPLWYFLARAYDGPARKTLAQDIQKHRKQGHWETPLQTALAVSALTRLGHIKGLEAARDYLLHAQTKDGSWPAEAFCLDPAQKGKAHFSGSAALTTAFIIEALSAITPSVAPATAEGDQRAVQLQTDVQAAAHAASAALEAPLRQTMRHRLEVIRRGDHNREIVLLPYFFAQSLQPTLALDNDFFIKLGLANAYGWLAYTIFDDFLDDEGKAPLLPAATTALRASVSAFDAALPKHEAFLTRVQQVFNTIDAANAWEVANCRFEISGNAIRIGALPRYTAKRLYGRSLGHALTPLAVLVRAGHSLEDPAVAAALKGLEHYLAARQLVDDLHDWEPDVRAGQISAVVAAILADLQQPIGLAKLPKLLPRMQHIFWHQTLPRMCGETVRHVALARKYLRSSGLLSDKNAITALLDSLDATLSDTRAEQAKAERFLAAYRV